MSLTSVQNYLSSLKKNYASLSQAYRKGEFEIEVEFTPATKETVIAPVKWWLADPRKRSMLIPFREAAVKLFKQAQDTEKERDRKELSLEDKEQLAEYRLRASVLSYEISDYFLIADKDMSKFFSTLTEEASKNVRAYYKKHYGFVVSPQVKVNIVKQIVLAGLSGVNVLYRSYDATKFMAGLEHVNNLINFLEADFPAICGRSNAGFGLLGLAYFLKGRLLLGKAEDDDKADRCFRLSAESYVRKLGERGEMRAAGSDGKGADVARHLHLPEGSAEVSVSELLAIRRAALALAFGSGYSALINSRVKEANSLLTLARGILHFNAPKVYASYVELLYWSAKRAEKSDDEETLLEAKRRIEECRKVFVAEVSYSHYPHRASLEHSMVLHYLAQRRPAEAVEYYREAVDELKAAVKFARGEGSAGKSNKQLSAEACYTLSHILRYENAHLSSVDGKESVAKLKEALHYAKMAEGTAKDSPRHRCEALLAICAVYADIAKRGLPLSEVDPQSAADADPGRLSRNYACKVLEINNGANHRISAICYLRLVDYYLKNPATYPRAYSYWADWLKIKGFIEHAFVLDWAARTEAELDRVKERSFVIDFAEKPDISEVLRTVYPEFVKQKISQWVRASYPEYQLENGKIIKKTGKPGPRTSLRAGIKKYLEETLKFTSNEAKKLIKENDFELEKTAKEMMESYLRG